jgi:hypothetical protein
VLAKNQQSAKLANFLFMTILAQAFLAFVSGHFMPLALSSTGQKSGSFLSIALTQRATIK